MDRQDRSSPATPDVGSQPNRITCTPIRQPTKPPASSGNEQQAKKQPWETCLAFLPEGPQG